jgi:uncharacterized protein
MKELVEYIARALVDNPDAVKVTEIETGQMIIYEIQAGEDETGKLIGRQGRIVKAVRSVVRAAGARQGKRVTVEVV